MELNIRTRIFMAISLAIFLVQQMKDKSYHTECGTASKQSEEVFYFKSLTDKNGKQPNVNRVILGDWVLVSGDLQGNMLICREENYSTDREDLQIFQFTPQIKFLYWLKEGHSQNKKILFEGDWYLVQNQLFIYSTDQSGENELSEYVYDVQMMGENLLRLIQVETYHEQPILEDLKNNFEQSQESNSLKKHKPDQLKVDQEIFSNHKIAQKQP